MRWCILRDMTWTAFAIRNFEIKHGDQKAASWSDALEGTELRAGDCAVSLHPHDVCGTIAHTGGTARATSTKLWKMKGSQIHEKLARHKVNGKLNNKKCHCFEIFEIFVYFAQKKRIGILCGTKISFKKIHTIVRRNSEPKNPKYVCM